MAHKGSVSEVVKARNDVFNQRTEDALMTVVSLVKNKMTRYYQDDFAWNYPEEQRTPELYAFVIQAANAQCVSHTRTTQEEREEYLTDIIITAAMFLADIRASKDNNNVT